MIEEHDGVTVYAKPHPHWCPHHLPTGDYGKGTFARCVCGRWWTWTGLLYSWTPMVRVVEDLVLRSRRWRRFPFAV